MSVIFMDNFASYGTGAAGVARMLNGLYAAVTASGAGANSIVPAADPDPNETGLCFRTQGATGFGGPRFVLPTGDTETIGIAYRLWMTSLPPSTAGLGRNTPGIVFRNGLNQDVACVWVSTTGQIVFSLGSDTGNVANERGRTPAPVLIATAWTHIEVKYESNGGVADAGRFEVRVEGTEVLTIEGLTLPAIPQLAFGTVANGAGGAIPGNFYKDFVIWDGEGTRNNDFLGSVLVFAMAPIADEALNWTTTGANGFSILDNAPPIDTQFIGAPYPAIPAAYVAELNDLPDDVTSVRALQTLVRARKTDGGDGSLQVSVLSGAAEAPGLDRPITTAFTYWWDISEEDPETDSGWTPPAANNARLKINRTT